MFNTQTNKKNNEKGQLLTNPYEVESIIISRPLWIRLKNKLGQYYLN
jgi:hypothetical protein